jgi:hypothetical protein
MKSQYFQSKNKCKKMKINEILISVSTNLAEQPEQVPNGNSTFSNVFFISLLHVNS